MYKYTKICIYITPRDFIKQNNIINFHSIYTQLVYIATKRIKIQLL